MKIMIDGLEETYRLCMSKGILREKKTDHELVRSLVSVAVKGIRFIDSISAGIQKDSTDWTFVFRDYYESLRCLIEAYLLLEGIVADNHQCKNAYICFKHHGLELDWNFLETARLKRNQVNYRGIFLKYGDWKALKLQFILHINVLKEAIENKLKQEWP